VSLQSTLFRQLWRRPEADDRQSRVVRLSQVDDALIAQWRDLETRALVPNPFLSPRFVLPLSRHLPDHAQIDLVLAFDPSRAEKKLVGVAAIERDRLIGFSRSERDRMAKSLYLPHARFLSSKYSFVGGALLDRDAAARAGAGLLAGLRRAMPLSQMAFFQSMPEEEAEVWRGLASSGNGVTVSSEPRPRPTFVPKDGGEEYLRAALSKSRYKDLARVRRRLEDRGKVEWRLVRDSERLAEAGENFLRLEHMGWKGEQGSSLLSLPARASFFRAVVQNFGETGDVFFCELLCDGDVVSSTSNLISGDVGYAFKVGWDPRFAQMSPGMLNEVETIRAAPALLGDLRYIDSCTGDESYIDRLWTITRRTLADGVLVLGPVGAGVFAAKRGLRLARDRLREFREARRAGANGVNGANGTPDAAAAPEAKTAGG
jgi:CelD/BcsL family acetyltransferase involved in cellulose biosynthesis